MVHQQYHASIAPDQYDSTTGRSLKPQYASMARCSWGNDRQLCVQHMCVHEQQALCIHPHSFNSSSLFKIHHAQRACSDVQSAPSAVASIGWDMSHRWRRKRLHKGLLFILLIVSVRRHIYMYMYFSLRTSWGCPVDRAELMFLCLVYLVLHL